MRRFRKVIAEIKQTPFSIPVAIGDILVIEKAVDEGEEIFVLINRDGIYVCDLDSEVGQKCTEELVGGDISTLGE